MWDAELVAEAEGVGLGVAVGVADAVAEGVEEGVPVLDGVAEGELVPVIEGEGEAVGVGEAVDVEVGERVKLGLGLDVRVGLGVGLGGQAEPVCSTMLSRKRLPLREASDFMLKEIVLRGSVAKSVPWAQSRARLKEFIPGTRGTAWVMAWEYLAATFEFACTLMVWVVEVSIQGRAEGST